MDDEPRRDRANNALEKFNHDPLAETYDAEVRQSARQQFNYIRENYFEIQQRVLEWAVLEPELRVLDVGIGTALMWEQELTPVELHGVDISQRMLKRASAKEVPAELRYGHFLELPFPDECFDRIVSTFAFHHVEHERKVEAFLEMARVLRKDGIIVIGDLMFRDPAQKAEIAEQMRRERRQDVIGDFEEEFFTDIEALRIGLEELGFILECEQGATLSWVVRVRREQGRSIETSFERS